MAHGYGAPTEFGPGDPVGVIGDGRVADHRHRTLVVQLRHHCADIQMRQYGHAFESTGRQAIQLLFIIDNDEGTTNAAPGGRRRPLDHVPRVVAVIEDAFTQRTHYISNGSPDVLSLLDHPAAVTQVSSGLNRAHLNASPRLFIELGQGLRSLVKLLEGIPAIGLGNTGHIGFHPLSVGECQYLRQRITAKTAE